MKYKNIILLGLALVVAALNQSCQKELQDFNTNPNQVNESRPEYLFTTATMNFNFGTRDALLTRYRVMGYMQYIVPDGANAEGLASRYWNPNQPTGPSPGFNYYADYYGGMGRDLNRIMAMIDFMDATRKESYATIRAVCGVLDTYQAWRVVDVYGAMAYNQAFMPDENPLPVYDKDWELYLQFDAQLKEVASILSNPPANQVSLGNQDFFYGGDLGKWLKFANTLRIKIAQRYEKRDPAHFASVLNDVATTFNGQIITSNEESFGYNNVRDWNNNVDDIANIFLSYVAAYPFVEYLKSTDDPRIAFMVRENGLGDNYARYRQARANGTAETQSILDQPFYEERYWGKHTFPASDDASFGRLGGARNQAFAVTNGADIPLNVQSNIQARLFVKRGGFGAFNFQDLTLLYDEELPVTQGVDNSTIRMRTPHLSAADAAFMMAEIAEKGGNGLGKSAAQWYSDGMTLSFDHYKQMAVAALVPGASSVTIGDLLSQVPYNGLESIYSQAWVNFLVNPEEAWAMWKRTGYPQFENVEAGQPNRIGDGSGIAYLEALRDGSVNLLIPRRMALPTPQAQNMANWAQAINDMKAQDAAYGASESDTKGRIWWDMQ